MNDIEIIEYKPFVAKADKPTALKGFCRLKISTPWGKLTCNEMQVFSKHGKHWVNFPARKAETQEGIKYFAFSRFESQDESQKFSDEVIKALKNFKPTSGSPDTQSAHPSASNGPRNAIPKPEPVSMSPAFSSKSFDDQLPF